MSKGILIGAIAIIIGALGFWYFYADPSEQTTEPTELQEETNTTPSSTTGTTPKGTNTFRSVFSQSGSYECKYEQVDSDSRTSSVITIADGKMRGEFRTMSGTDSIGSLMIYDGNYLYSWKEGATVGRKTSIRTIADLPEAIPADLTSGAVYGGSLDNVGWDCHPWAKDQKAFVLPTYVKFSAAS